MPPFPNKGYFASTSWGDRLNDALQRFSSGQPSGFAEANKDCIQQLVKHARPVFNIGPAALLAYLRTGRYKNAYERPVIGGVVRHPSPSREWVDNQLGFDNPGNIYFCALSLEGSGIRFYGEYCVALKTSSLDQIDFILDRNSYDLLAAPLRNWIDDGERDGGKKMVARLRADESATDSGIHSDINIVLTIKVLRGLPDNERLVTAGMVAERLLEDEDFVEAYHKGRIQLNAIDEVRSSPAESAMECDIRQRQKDGERLTAEETLWLSRQHQVRQGLKRGGIKRRVVSGSGRDGRWSDS